MRRDKNVKEVDKGVKVEEREREEKTSVTHRCDHH